MTKLYSFPLSDEAPCQVFLYFIKAGLLDQNSKATIQVQLLHIFVIIKLLKLLFLTIMSNAFTGSRKSIKSFDLK